MIGKGCGKGIRKSYRRQYTRYLFTLVYCRRQGQKASFSTREIREQHQRMQQKYREDTKRERRFTDPVDFEGAYFLCIHCWQPSEERSLLKRQIWLCFERTVATASWWRSTFRGFRSRCWSRIGSMQRQRWINIVIYMRMGTTMRPAWIELIDYAEFAEGVGVLWPSERNLSFSIRQDVALKCQ